MTEGNGTTAPTTSNVVPLETTKPAEAPKAEAKPAPAKKAVTTKKPVAKKVVAKAKTVATTKKAAPKVTKPAAKRIAGMKAQGQVPKAAFDAMIKHCKDESKGKDQEYRPADYVRDAVIAQLKRDKIWEPKA